MFSSTITINSTAHSIKTISTNSVVIDFCSQLGYDIPRFCYHENLKIAGNCRMCLIEDSKAAKPVVCCAMPTTDGLSIFTNTSRVKKARESVMEFLLINHPLDCPICDQGGECDLQDLSLIYGSDHGRFYEYKRNIEDKNIGPVVKTIMNRCILCTRCVRFANDVAGFKNFGLTGRGVHMEIGSYVERLVNTDFSGNLVDICPVGALTSKPYSFTARPWELKSINTIAIFDDIIQQVRADVKENNLLRIIPNKNYLSKNSWITNRTRFSYEGVTKARLLFPHVLGEQLTWVAIFRTITQLLINVSKFSFEKFNSVNFNFSLLPIKDVLFLKRCMNNFGYIYNSKNRFSSLSLSDNNDLMLVSNNPVSLVLLNVDLQYTAPILGTILQSKLLEGAIFNLLSWSSFTFPAMAVTKIANSINALYKTFRGKQWQSLMIYKTLKFIAFCNNSVFSAITAQLSSFLPFFAFFVNMYKTPGDRAANLLNSGLSATNAQNSKYIYSTLYHSISCNNYFINSLININQTSHKPKAIPFLNKALLFELPAATIYEYNNSAAFFDEDYNIVSTSRVLVSNYKTNFEIAKALSHIFHTTQISDSRSVLNVKVQNVRFQPLNTSFANRVKFKKPVIVYNNMITYYTAYALTAHSPVLLETLRTDKFLHNIYTK